MVDRQMFLSSYVIRRAQDLRCKHSVGVVLPPRPVPASDSDDVTGAGGSRLYKVRLDSHSIPCLLETSLTNKFTIVFFVLFRTP